MMREMGGAVCSRLMKKECNVGMVIVRMWLTNSAGYERRFRLLEVSNGKAWEGLERSGYECEGYVVQEMGMRRWNNESKGLCGY